MAEQQDYTILDVEKLSEKVDYEQTSGSNLFIGASDLDAKNSVKGFETYENVMAFSESFRNNIRKDSKQESATAGGTTNSGFVEIYIPEGVFSYELQRKGLSSNPIAHIHIHKTKQVNGIIPTASIKYQNCNIVYCASNLGTYLFMRFAFDVRTVKYTKLGTDGSEKGNYGFTYDVKQSKVADE